MLEIKINSTLIDMFEDTELSITYKNNLFNFDNIYSSYSMPIKVPLTAKNKILFNHIEEVTEKVYYYDCSVYINGLLFSNGKIEVIEVLDNSLECNMYLNFGNYIEKLNDYIDEIDIYGGNIDFDFEQLGIRDMEDGEELAAMAEKQWAIPMFEIRNRNNLNGFNSTFANENERGNYLYLDYSGYFTPTIPCAKLYYVLQCIANYLGLSLAQSDFFLQNPQNRIVIINNKDISNHTFNPSRNNGKITQFNIMNHLPRITIAGFLQALKNFFCLNIVISNGVISFSPIKRIINDIDNFELKNIKDFKISNYQEPNSLLLKWDRDNMDSLLIDYNIEKTQEIRYTNNIQSENPPDNDDMFFVDRRSYYTWNEGYPAIYKYHVIENSGVYYKQWHPIMEENGTHLGISQNYISDLNPDYEVNLHVCPMNTSTIYNEFHYSVMHMPINSTLAKEKFKQEYNLRLAFWNYCFFSTDDIRSFASHIDYLSTSEYDLELWGENRGIFNYFWSDVWNYLKNSSKKVEFSTLMSQRDIMALDFQKKVLVNNELYFVEELSFSVNIQGEFSEVKMICRGY